MKRSGAEFLRMLAARRGSHVVLEKRRAPRKRARLLRKLRPQRQPDAIRRTYAEALWKITAAARDDVRRVLYPHGPALVAEAAHLRGDSIALDSPAASVSTIMREIAADFFAEFTNERIASVVRHFGKEISDFQRTEVARQFERVIGFDPFRIGEAWLPKRIEEFTAENVALIRTVPERYFSDLETRIIRDLRAGLRWEEIAPEIEERYGVSESNAERIARDQAGKFFGELNATRQQAVGVERFTWRTARDNRVRDAHVLLEGKVFAWEGGGDPEEGLPGEPINCRCQGEPILDDLLDALGVEPEAAAEPVAEPEPAPTPAPATPENLHERMGGIARDVFGDDFTSKSIALDADVGKSAGFRRFTGEIEIAPESSKQLRSALESIGTGRTITAEEAQSISTILHEEIHGLGKWKAPTPDASTWSDYKRAYSNPFGRLLEEGSTELRAVRGWREFATRLGMDVPEHGGPYFDSFGTSGYGAGGGVAYVDEVRAVDTLCRYAAGPGNLGDTGAFSSAAEKVLVGISSEWNPIERASRLADAILSHAPAAMSENTAFLRRDLLLEFFGQVHYVPQDLPRYLDRILAATNTEEVLAVRKWLNLA